MRPGQELNVRIATEVLGYPVRRFKGVLTETRPLGDRPLRNYTNEMEWAWEVAEKMKVTLIPIVDGQWFAFVGSPENSGWASPQAVLQFLEAGDFANSGAALENNPAFAICMAGLKAAEKANAKKNTVEVDENLAATALTAEPAAEDAVTH